MIPEDGVYYVAVGGGMPTDPFDETTGTNTDITSLYEAMFIVDADESFLGVGLADWTANGGRKTAQTTPTQLGKKGPLARFAELLDQRKADANAGAEAAAAANAEEEPLDFDYYLVDLRKGDAIAGGFDASRQVGILDPDGVQRSGASFNPSFIYPLESPLRHDRRNGFDHVATVDGTYAVFVGDGLGEYQGEMSVIRSGLADERNTDQQIIFLDFDGAIVPGDVWGTRRRRRPVTAVGLPRAVGSRCVRRGRRDRRHHRRRDRNARSQPAGSRRP